MVRSNLAFLGGGVLAMAFACSVVNAPDDPLAPVGEGGGAGVSSSGGDGGTGSGTGGGTGGAVACDGPNDCDALDGDCAEGVCDDGTCVAEPLPAGALCGDQGTTSCDQPDLCDGSAMCAPNYQPDGTACDDDLCIDAEECTVGVCEGGMPKDCSSVTAGCNKGVCEAGTGNCITTLETVCVAGDSCCPAGCTVSNDADCSAVGTVLDVNGLSIPVQFATCGAGVPGTCTAAIAKSSCAALGRKVVSHASDGNTQVLSLGATASCNWSISYYTLTGAVPMGACLVAVSNLDWLQCCDAVTWHGNTVTFAAPGTLFGYVFSGDSGYVSTNPNISGGTWGCQGIATAAPALTGCTTEYVACAL